MRRTPILLALLLGLSIAAPSALASGKDVIRDCTFDEVLSKTYTQQEYADALAQLAGDGDQYGNCRDVIRRAQLQALRDARLRRDRRSQSSNQPGTAAPAGPAGGGGGGGFGSAPAEQQLSGATPQERKAVDEGRGSAGRPVSLQGVAVDPGIKGSGDLPAPLVVLLILVLAGALALAATRVRELVLTRRA